MTTRASPSQTSAAAPPVRISPPDSVQEREADRMADAVMRGGLIERGAPTLPGARRIHRQCDACASGGPVCTQCAQEEDDELMLKRSGAVSHPPSGAQAAVASVSQSGTPLPVGTQAYFEPRFGADLSHVRIHPETRAASGINARAFTFGNHIAFAPGQFAPRTQAGRHLIAHELAHVLAHAGPGRLWREPEDCSAETANSARVHDVYTSVITADGYAVPVPYLSGFSVDELACLLEKLDNIRRENPDDDEIRMRVMGFVGDRLNPALKLIQRSQPEQAQARQEIGDALFKAERLQRDVGRTLGPLSQGHVAQQAYEARTAAENVTEQEGAKIGPDAVELLRARAKFAAGNELNFEPEEFSRVLDALSIVETEISENVALEFYRTYDSGTLEKSNSVKPWAETQGDTTQIHPTTIDGRLPVRSIASILLHEFGGHINQPGRGGQAGVANEASEARPYAIDLTAARLLGAGAREGQVTQYAEASFIDEAPAAANFCVSVAALWALRQASNGALPQAVLKDIGEPDPAQAESLFDEMMTTIPPNYSSELSAFIERIRAGFFQGGRMTYGWIARNADIPDVCTGRLSAPTSTPETIRNGTLQ